MDRMYGREKNKAVVIKFLLYAWVYKGRMSNFWGGSVAFKPVIHSSAFVATSVSTCVSSASEFC